METILTATSVYISTSIDYLFLLIILFAQQNDSSIRKHIYAGQYFGTGILVAISLFAAYIIGFVPADWMIGLLGFIPIFLGLRFAFIGEEEENEEEIISKVNQSGTNQLFLTVTLLTIASGGDNLGIYIPYFASIAWAEIFTVLFVFAIGIIILCEISRRISAIPILTETIEKYERLIIPIVFTLLGIYILFENGTINTLKRLIMNI